MQWVTIALLFVLIHAPLAAQTTTWIQVSNTGPSARRFHAMAYDSQRGRTMLFGGARPIIGARIMLGDTWERDGSTWMP